MSDILVKNIEMPKDCLSCPIKECEEAYELMDGRPNGCPLILVPEHNDLADKSVIIERMGDAYEALYDKVDKKALSECHIAFLKAVMYSPTVVKETPDKVLPRDWYDPAEDGMYEVKK